MACFKQHDDSLVSAQTYIPKMCLTKYNELVQILTNDSQYNIENNINKNLFYKYLTFTYEDNEYLASHYRNDLFELIIKSSNMNNFEYMLKSGINVQHNKFGDYGSLFIIVLLCQKNYIILEKQLKMLISYGFDIHNFTLGDGENGTEYDNEYPSFLFAITTYSCDYTDNHDFFMKKYLLLKQLGVNHDIRDLRGNKCDFYLTNAIAEPIN
jgi:hypothetical protein